MTGPPYPLPPTAGANAAGIGPAGVFPTGDLPILTLWNVIVSQYSNSPVLTAILTSFYAAVDQLPNLDAFYDNIMNVDTASGYGLDVWGRIVGVNRILTVQNEPIFGFEQALTTAVGFNQGRFYRPGVTSNYILSDQQFRRLILAKALANISGATISNINKMLLMLFPNRGNCWVQDNIPYSQTYFGFQEAGISGEGFGQAPFYNRSTTSGMRMTYIFTFPLSAVDLGIMSSGVLPKPVGVTTSIQII